jgi:hypothetical protein
MENSSYYYEYNHIDISTHYKILIYFVVMYLAKVEPSPLIL